MGRISRGTLFRRTKGGHYWLLYYVNGRRVRRTLGTGDRREAEKRRDEIIRPLQLADTDKKLRAVIHQEQDIAGEIAAIRERNRPKLQFAESWERYLESTNRPQSGDHTLADYRRQWSRFSEWMALRGKLLVEETTPDDAEAYLGYCQNTLELGPNRYNKTLHALRLVFRILSTCCGQMADPFQGATKKKRSPHRHRDLSEAELQAVLRQAEGEFRTLLMLGAYCGFRLHDACLLQWGRMSAP
jgi:integrase